MKHIFFILFLFPIVLFSQTIDIRKSDGLTTEENCFLALGAQQNTINANTVIELRDDVAGVSVNNGITYDNVTFRATLKKDKTYKLQAFIRHIGSTSNTAAGYKWFDVTNATFIGIENQVQSSNALGNDGVQPSTATIITPTTDIEVELRCIGVSVANQSISLGSTYAIIEKISELLFSPAGPTSIGNADSLGGQPASFYMDIFTNQNIAGLKVYKDDLVLDSTLSIGISAPDGSAILDITSTTKGLLYPRMTTTQRDNIPSPVTGLSVYNITNNDPNFFNGTAWRRITHAPGSSLEIGSVIFATGVSALDGDSANFFWDIATKRLGLGISDPDERIEIAGRIHLGQTTVPATTTDKLYNESGTLFWNGIDLTSPGTTIEFTSTFDNTLITKLSGAGTVVYDVSNPSTGQIAINGGTVTKVGKLLAYQFHVISDQDAEFVLVMDVSLVPGEIVSMSVVADDGSLHQLGLRSPGARQIRFNRDDAINADLDHHLIVWVDGGTEIAIIPVGTFTGTAGSIPFSNGTSIVEDNANLFYDDVNNRLGLGTTTPTEIVHLQKSGSDNYLKIDAGGTASNFSGLMLTENNINFGWTLRYDANTDNLFISIQDNTPTFTDIVTYKRDGKIDAPKDHQVFTATINGSGTWQTVNYPASFPSGSTIRVFATAQDDNGIDYFVRVRSVGLTSFQFIPRNHNGGIHTGAGVIGFWAIRQN